jgi:DNA-dependent protein kinase catalytic subunit
MTVYGSNEKKYMVLIKAGEDVRLDQRIEELFEVMNRILKTNSECSKKQL